MDYRQNKRDAFYILCDCDLDVDVNEVVDMLDKMSIKHCTSINEAARAIKVISDAEWFKRHEFDLTQAIEIVGLLSDLGYRESSAGVIIENILCKFSKIFKIYLDKNLKIDLIKMINNFSKSNINPKGIISIFGRECGQVVNLLIENERKYIYKDVYDVFGEAIGIGYIENNNVVFHPNNDFVYSKSFEGDELFEYFYLGFSFIYLGMKYVVTKHEDEYIQCDFYSKDLKRIDKETFNVEEMTALKTYFKELKEK